jgi:hypothetical protein
MEHTMRIQSIGLALVIVLVCRSASAHSRQPTTHHPGAYTDIPAGPVSGVWTVAGSPYLINGTITIPNDSTLTIAPGVEVVFMGHYKLNVQGRLLAVGTEGDTIRFRAADTPTGWHGIRFDGTANTNDTSKIIYCVLRNGKAVTGSGFDRCGGAILIREFDRVLLSNCLLDSNMQSGEGWEPIPEAGPAIYIYHASPVITNSVFSHHTGSKGCAIACLACPRAIISNNVFRRNIGAWAGPIVIRENGSSIISGNIITDNVGQTAAGGGICIETGASPRIENNIITSNFAPYGGGILCWQNTNAVLLNNTIANNSANQGGGIFCTENSDPVLVNNILYGNTSAYGGQVCIYDVESDPHFLYCDIQGGKEGFSGAGAGVSHTGRYENNIDADPLFINAGSEDYRLSDASPCIGAGVDSIEVSGVWYHAPPTCFGGDARPSPAGSKPDLGARENPLGTPVGVVPEASIPAQCVIHQNYPNPFNPSTTITYALPKSSDVRLSVCDMLGREVSVLVNERKDAGVHEVKFDASGLASGVYLYRLQAGEFVQTRKLVLLQ